MGKKKSGETILSTTKTEAKALENPIYHADFIQLNSKLLLC